MVRKLIAELGELRPDRVYFRAHNLLCTGDGTPALKWGSTGVYTEDEQGRPVYNWTVLDRIFDTYRAAACDPMRRSVSCLRHFLFALNRISTSGGPD
jgi:xylan 1,4-beta-xylosidase